MTFLSSLESLIAPLTMMLLAQLFIWLLLHFQSGAGWGGTISDPLCECLDSLSLGPDLFFLRAPVTSRTCVFAGSFACYFSSWDIQSKRTGTMSKLNSNTNGINEWTNLIRLLGGTKDKPLEKKKATQCAISPSN